MKWFEHPSDIKCGVIGYGGSFNMGKQHLNEMKKAGMTPWAVCEIDPARLEVAKQDFPGIETWSSVEEMLARSEVNLIAIITPHNTHAELAVQCLKAKKHICCEKPLAITTDECDAILKAAVANQVVASTYHNRHWDGCILHAVQKIVREQVIGKVFRIDAHMGGFNCPRDWWRSSKTISGGILYDWGVHLLEYSLQIINSNIKEVSGFAHWGHWAPHVRWKEDTNEDDAFAVVRFTDGSLLTLHMSNLNASPRPGWLEIHGTKGCYIMSGTDYEIRTYDPEKKEIQVEKGENPPGEQWRYYQNIADHLTGQAELIISTEWARRPIHILDLACQSARENRTLLARYP